MSIFRTQDERSALAAEAERRVRAGQSLADVAHDLGVPRTTLGGWAHAGRWRHKDLAFERNEERSQAALAQIAELAAREQKELLQRTARTKELAEAAEAAMRAADPEGDGHPSGLTVASTSSLSMTMARNLLQQGRLDEADRAARFALHFAQAEKATNARQAVEWRDDRARILKWWENNRAGFAEFQKEALATAQELEGDHAYRRELLGMNCCPACSRPMDFWPVAMEEEMDRISEAFELMDP